MFKFKDILPTISTFKRAELLNLNVEGINPNDQFYCKICKKESFSKWIIANHEKTCNKRNAKKAILMEP